MNEVNDLFDKAVNEVSFYKPSTDGPKKTFRPFIEGEYYGHIVNVQTRIVDVQGKYRARVYNYAIKVASKNSDMKYVKNGIDNKPEEVSGKEYVGRLIYAKGVFRFLEPGNGDAFEANPEGNKSYYYFCQAIGLDCKDVTKEIDGEMVTFKELPNLTTDAMEGQPVIGVSGFGKPYTNKDGNEVVPFNVKFVKKWEKGRVLDEDIPF